MYIFSILALVVAFISVRLLISSNVEFLGFIDIPSLIVLVLVIVCSLAASHDFRNFTNAFAIAFSRKKQYSKKEMKLASSALDMVVKVSFGAAGFSIVFGAISMLTDLSDKSKFGPPLALILCTLFYASILVILLLPIKSRIEKKIIDIEV